MKKHAFGTVAQFFLLGIPVVLLICPYYNYVQVGKLQMLAGGLLLDGFLSVWAAAHGKTPRFLRLENPWVTVPVCLLFGILTYIQWTLWKYTARIAAHLPISVEVLLIAAPLAQFAAALPGMDCLVSILREFLHQKQPAQKQSSPVWLLAGAAVLILLFASKSSPLYPMNDWSDANTYFTIGKGILKGKVMYRDLLDHKGPLLYLLHALAAMVSFDSFLGIFLLEIACCFGTMWFFYRILEPDFGKSVWVPLVLCTAMIYASPAFSHGDSAEELCLPLLAYGMYVGIRCLRAESLPGKREWFFIGLTSGCVLWIKFTMLCFYMGWIVAPGVLALRKQRIGELFRGLGLIVLGVAVSTVPPAVYFLVEGGFGDWMEIYFYCNLFLYSGGTLPVIAKLAVGFWLLATHSPVVLVLILLGAAWVFQRENGYVQLFFGAMLVLFFCMTCIFGSSLYYYTFALAALSVFGIGPLTELFPRDKKCLWALPAAAALALALTPNNYLLLMPKSEMPQYRFRDTIMSSGVENPTVLNCGFMDAGFYLADGYVPDLRFFGIINLMSESGVAEQTQYIRDGKADFVITRGDETTFGLVERVGEPEMYEELTKGDYRIVDKATFRYEQYIHTYYLHQRVK